MELSRHAVVRKQQRGFQTEDLELIMRFGTYIRKPGNVIEYRMDQKNAKFLVQAIDRIRGKAVLVSDDEEIVITVYNRRNVLHDANNEQYLCIQGVLLSIRSL